MSKQRKDPPRDSGQIDMSAFLPMLQKEMALAVNPQAEQQASDTLGQRTGSYEKRQTAKAQAQERVRGERGQSAVDRARSVLPAMERGARQTATNTADATTAGRYLPPRMGAQAIPGSETTQQTGSGQYVQQQNQRLADAQKALQLLQIASTRGKGDNVTGDWSRGIAELQANPMQLAPIVRMFTGPSAEGRAGQLLDQEQGGAPMNEQQNALLEAQRLYQLSGQAPTTIQRDIAHYGAQIPTFLAEGEGIARGLGLAGKGVANVAQNLAPDAVQALRMLMSSPAGKNYLVTGALERGAIGAGERAMLGGAERLAARGAVREGEHGIANIAREKAGELAKHEVTATSAHGTRGHGLEDLRPRLVYGM